MPTWERDESPSAPATGKGRQQGWQAFTASARHAVLHAQQAAHARGQIEVGPAHLALGLLDQKTDAAILLLEALKIASMTIARKAVAELPAEGTSSPSVATSEMRLSPEGKQAIDLAFAEARGLGHNYIGTEHLLLGLLALGQGAVADTFHGAGQNLLAVREAVRHLGERPLKVALANTSGDLTWDRLTELGRRAVTAANRIAVERGENQVRPEHLLLAVLQAGGEAPRRLLKDGGASVTPDELRKHLSAILTPGPGRDDRKVKLDSASIRVLDLAFAEAGRVNNRYIGPEHILLGILAADGGPSGIVLRQFGPTLSAARSALIRRIGSADTPPSIDTVAVKPSSSGPVAVRQRAVADQRQTQPSAQKPRPLWKDVLLALFLMLLFAFLLGMLHG